MSKSTTKIIPPTAEEIEEVKNKIKHDILLSCLV